MDIIAAFWSALAVVVFFDIWFWILESIPSDVVRLWPATDEELRDRGGVA